MAKYKLLITGRDTTLIHDFVRLYSHEYKIYSCSHIYEDVFNHVELINPDIIMFALSGEKHEELQRLAALPKWFENMSAQVFAVGDQTECGIFQAATNCLAHAIILQPTTVDVIHRKTVEHMYQYEFMLEEMKKAEELEAQGGAKENADTIVQKKHHVLVVDDDPIMLKTMKDMLHDEYDVATAINGKVALRFLEAKFTDIVILDYDMPEMSGAETLEAIRRDPHTAKLPVIFLTGVTNKEKISTALSYKPQGYLLKPIQKMQLTETIKKVLKI